MSGGMDTGFVGAGDSGVRFVNESGLSDFEVLPSLREVASRLETYVRETRAQTGGGMWQRSKYVSSDNPYDQIRTARRAVDDDDVVGAAADETEALALQSNGMESSDENVEDIFNQVAEDLDMDSYMRTVYRELFGESQSVTASWWGWKTYRSRVTSGGAPKRTVYRLYVPTKLITLDNLSVVPVGNRLFGQDRLAWYASRGTMDYWTGFQESPETNYDPLMAELFVGKYTPGQDERAQLTRWGVDPDRLLEMRPDRVWRTTRTRSSYQPFANVRMKSIFRDLDLKQQLLESDRVSLVGSANYLLLVKKGSDEQPAAPEELRNLKEGFSVLAKLPVIVSDHRLEIEIIAPDLSNVLASEKYDTLDERILARLMGAVGANTGARGDQTAGTTSRMIARGLENIRHGMRRDVEKHVITAAWEHPANQEALSKYKPSDKPGLIFNPRHVQLDNDSQLITAIMAARERRDLSRHSTLEFMGFDQAAEARHLKTEAEVYDKVFKTQVPFSAQPGDITSGPGADQNGAQPAGNPAGVGTRVQGSKGGRPQGGGTSARSTRARVGRRTATGAPSTGGN